MLNISPEGPERQLESFLREAEPCENRYEAEPRNGLK